MTEMTLNQAILGSTAATDALLAAINVDKVMLDQKVAAASDSAATALSSKNIAVNKAEEAAASQLATTAARLNTGQDKIATAADRLAVSNFAAAVSINKDTSVTKAGEAVLSANTASIQATNAGNSAVSAASNSAVAANQAAIATNKAMTASEQAAIATVQAATASAQSQLAQTAASSASSVLQQDLSAVSAALHRSPNPVTAMFLYDTSKDSDGGAWIERMQHTSWANEPLAGAWLPGGFATELLARGDNLLAYTQEFTNAFWIKTGTGTGVAPVITVNNAAAPDGTTSASTIVFNAGAGATLGDRSAISTNFISVTGTPYATSVVIKGVTGTQIIIRGPAGNAYTLFTLNGAWQTIATTETAYQTSGNIEIGIRQGANGTLNATATVQIAAIKVNQVGVLPSTYSASPELVSNGGFDNGTVGWTASAITGTPVPLENIAGSLRLTSQGAFATATVSLNTVVGKVYALSVGAFSGTQSTTNLRVGTALHDYSIKDLPLNKSLSTSFVFAATSAITHLALVGGTPTAGAYADFDNISVKEVTTLATPYVPYSTQTNSYYQSSADGKYYKLGATYGALTEVFRGNKAKFSRLAMIVGESNNNGLNRISIYDCTEPGRPMWMTVTSKPNDYSFNPFIPGVSGTTPTSISAANGIIAIGFNGITDRYGYLRLLKFAFDTMQTYSNGSNKVSSVGIAKRNTTEVGFPIEYAPGGSAAPGIVNGVVNAVAMTVLPDAPFDVATGIQIPTIACLVGESLVSMADGSSQRIDQVQIGSKVKTLEGEFTVLNWWDQGVKEVSEFEFDSGFKLTCTADHKIRTTAGWVEAGRLTSEHEVIGL